jgi:hypothetical protein
VIVQTCSIIPVKRTVKLPWFHKVNRPDDVMCASAEEADGQICRFLTSICT